MSDAVPVPEKPCPICRRRAQLAYRPFCTKRCADVDLNRWLSGVYAVPVAPSDEDDEGDFPPPPPPRRM